MPCLCGPISSISFISYVATKDTGQTANQMHETFYGFVTRATEPDLAPSTDPLSPEDSKLTVKLKFNVLLSCVQSLNNAIVRLDSGSHQNGNYTISGLPIQGCKEDQSLYIQHYGR